jgi:protocadherin Fat 1/2/3
LDSAEGQFEVDGRTGLVSLARALDREERDSYNVTLRALDSGRPRNTALVSLLVRVLGKSMLLKIFCFY